MSLRKNQMIRYLKKVSLFGENKLEPISHGGNIKKKKKMGQQQNEYLLQNKKLMRNMRIKNLS